MSDNHIHRTTRNGTEFTVTKEGAVFLDGAQLVIPHHGKMFLTDLYKMLDDLDSDSAGEGMDNLEEYVEALFVEDKPAASLSVETELWHGFTIEPSSDGNALNIYHQALGSEVNVTYFRGDDFAPAFGREPYFALCDMAAKDYFDSHPVPKELSFPLPDDSVFREGSRIINLAPGLISTENGDVLNWAGQNYVRQETPNE